MKKSSEKYYGCLVLLLGACCFQSIAADINFSVSPTSHDALNPTDTTGTIARPMTTEKKSVSGGASGGKFGSASGILSGGNFPTTSLSGEYTLEANATTFSFSSGGVFLPAGSGGGGTPPNWSFQFNRELIAITPKESEIEIYQSVTFSTLPSDIALSVSPSSREITGKTVKFNDANNYQVSITKNGVPDTSIVKVNPKIVNFGAKNDPAIWPKANGDSISKNDFNINFEPIDAEWIYSAPDGTPDLEPGEIRTCTAKAIVTKNGNSTEKECSYTVMGAGEWWEELPLPTTVNESFSNVELKTSSTFQEIAGIFIYERRNGSITGSGNFIEKDFVGWTVKGGTLESSTSTGYEISASLGATWKAATAQVGFSYSVTDSVSFGHSGISGYRIAMKGYKQNLPTTTAGVSTQRRQITSGNPQLAIFPTDSGWYAVNDAFSEPNTGSGNPTKCLGKKFP